MALPAVAQDQPKKGLTLRGSIQTDMLVPENDKQAGITKDNGDFLNNTYVELDASLKNFDAGVRLEHMQYPLPGFEPDFKGWGVPYYYLKWQTQHVELTAGTFYEQFGSGFVLRNYEERSLGVDNSLLGGRLKPTRYRAFTLRLWPENNADIGSITLAGWAAQTWNCTSNSGCQA